ncbi:MAG TPA: PKD domain-containing protein [Ohtaekwangia sp.]
MKFFYLIRTAILVCLFCVVSREAVLAQCSGITGGVLGTSLGQKCANLDLLGPGAEIRIQALNVPVGTSSVSFLVIWDDGTTNNTLATQMTPTSWEVPSLFHHFPTTGAEVKCEYNPRVVLFVNGTPCNTNFGSPPKFTRWNLDQENSGTLALNETVTGTNTYFVCRGSETTITFTDQSTLNCVPPEFNDPDPANLNTLQRWRRFTYGTLNTITSASGVRVNGTLVSSPFQDTEVTDNPTQSPLSPVTTLPITIPADAQVGEEFEITMEYWNTCNPFPGGPPAIQTARIQIIDQLPSPTATNNTVCNGTNPLPDFSITLPAAFAGARVNWFADNSNSPGTIIPFSTTSRLSPAAIGINGSVPGVYRVWASYNGLNNTQNQACESQPIPVTLTIRPEQVPVASGISKSVCSDAQGGNTFAVDLLVLQPDISTGAGLTYTWFTNGSDFVNSQIPAGPVNLTSNVPVFVRVENGVSGCYTDAQVRYTVNPTPDISAAAVVKMLPPFHISCNGSNDGQINVSALHGSGHLFSRDGNNYVPAVAFMNLGPGLYTIRTKNAEGCKDSVDVTILEPSAITALTGSTGASCFNAPNPDGAITVNASGGAGQLKYFLLQDPGNITGATTGNFTGLRAGNYTVRIEDENHCLSVTPVITVTQPPQSNASFSLIGSSAKCSGETFTFQWQVEANTDYVWRWGDGEDSVILANVVTPGVQQISHAYFSFDPLNNSNIKVYLEARNSLAVCEAAIGMGTVTVFPTIFLNVFQDKTEICSGDEVRFTNLTHGGTTHRWFYRTLGGTDELDERISSTPSAQRFQFTNAPASGDPVQNPLIYEIVYEVSNGTCSTSRVMRDTVYQGMTAGFDVVSMTPFSGGNARVNFANTSDPLDAASFRYNWEYGEQANPVQEENINPGQVRYTSHGPKTIRLTVTNRVAEAAGLQCSVIREEIIQIPLPPIQADFEYTPQSACFPSDIHITENRATGDRYEWTLFRNGIGVFVSNDTLPTFSITSAGEYVIKLKTWNSLLVSQRDSIDNSDQPISIFKTPRAVFQPSQESVFTPDAEGMTMFNLSEGSTSWSWEFGDGEISNEFEPQHFYQEEGTYTVSLVSSFAHTLSYDHDDNGVVDEHDVLVCSDTIMIDVKALEGGRVRIPNAFTPNPSGPNGGIGDGQGDAQQNDVFLPLMTGVEEFEMQVYDRWGNLVFESRSTNQGWDGYDKHGRLLPAGVYVYKITMRLSDSERTTQVGDITLIR